MVLKRSCRELEGDIPSRESKRGLKFTNIGGDLGKGFLTHETLAKLESFMQNVVRDQVERSVKQFYRQYSEPSLNQIESSRARTLELHFIGEFPKTLFTGNKVESMDCKPIKIVIRDIISNNIITSGPLSSIKIEILVLDGDFGSDDQEDWSEVEFTANRVTERVGKKPLLVGELRFALEGGVGEVSQVVFTDNSSWIRGRKFRLGARIVQGNYDGVRIREARSEAFVVKDHRGESYKKNHPPAMEDEVWRLERIAKDGAFHKKLAARGITTVRDFTRLYHLDPKYLRDILGGGISNRTWEIIIEHATACVVDEKLFASSTDMAITLVFDSVFKAVGVIFNGQNLQSLDELSDLQRGLIKNLKGQAYKNMNAWIPLDGTYSAFEPAMTSQPDPNSSPSSGLEQVLPSMQQDQMEMQSDPNYANQVLDNAFVETNYLVGPNGGDSSQIGHLATEYNFPFCQSPCEFNDLFSGFTDYTSGIVSPNFSLFSRSATTPRARWRMIKAALTWMISVRRDIAAKKKKANPFYPTFLGNSY